MNNNKPKHITEEEYNQHKSRTIYLRDDYCDWGSSGMNEFTNEYSEDK